jgi:hypothetical protein
MILYRYTSARHLRGIARHGLTVGDVPTDIRRGLGRVGVWLTSAATAEGHGLEGSVVDKKQYRLTVEAPEESPLLVKWSEWAPKNVTVETIRGASIDRRTARGRRLDKLVHFFGILHPSAIRSCVETTTGTQVTDWAEVSPRRWTSRACRLGAAVRGIVSS